MGRSFWRSVTVGIAAMLMVAGCQNGKSPAHSQDKTMAKGGISSEAWGKTPDGTPVTLYTLTNEHGMIVKLTNYGATITSIQVSGRDGKMADVALGYDTLEGYLSKGNPYFGCTAGRVANRIARGRFTLDGKTYSLAINNGPNHLHGGMKGFDKRVWKTDAVQDSPAGQSVKFSYVSPDGEEGYPGTVHAGVTFTLTDDNALRISYEATADKATPINLTNHTYFNLAGASGKGVTNVLGQEMTIHAKRYTPVDDTQIPTGELKSVKGTPMDFTTPHAIGSRIEQVPGGYDHNYVLDETASAMHPAARATDPDSGRTVEVETTEPGVQFYTGNFLDGTIHGKGGAIYQKHAGFCLETQHFPDSPNHPKFPSVILRPGETYKSSTVYRFSAE